MAKFSQAQIDKFRKLCKKIKKNIITMLAHAGSGHPGGSLSATEIGVMLFFHEMNFDLNNPEHDRFILSKGHACPLLYAIFVELGLYPFETIYTLRKLGSPFQGHPCRLKTKGIFIPTGSLGQGLSGAIGMALAGKLDNKKYRVYVLLGDGECQEGQLWEAAMCAAHYKLDNICAIVDYNELQIDGSIYEIMNPEPFVKKWRSFRWNAIPIDGHDFNQIADAFDKARKTKDKPTVIVAKTIKGKGVSFMERQVDWHGKAPTMQQAKIALEDLENE
jgi:transketolase